MERNRVRPVYVWVAVVVVGVAVALLAIGGLGRAAAQDGVDGWTSSANPPSGTPSESDSTAGSPEDGFQGEDDRAPDGLVSLRFAGSTLKPRETNVSYTVGTDGACTYVTAGSNFTVWNVETGLPNGAVVDTLRMYFYDTNASDSTGWFTIYDLYGTIVQEWSVSSTGNFGNSFTDSAQINHTIDYSIYSYVLNWRPNVTGSTMQLCGFRIFYSPPFFSLGFLPTILDVP